MKKRIRRLWHWIWKHGDAVADAAVVIAIGHDLTND